MNADEADAAFEKAKKDIAEFRKVPGSYVSEKTMPMYKLKAPLTLAEYKEKRARFGYWPLQLGGDDAAYYYTRMCQYVHCQRIMPRDEVAPLERAIDPRIENMTFKTLEGTDTPTLTEFMLGNSRKRAMMMAYKGKVVFEFFPGMKPNDDHLWFSATKTTVALVLAQLITEGKVSMKEMTSKYIPELQGSPWDEIPLWATSTSATGLDIEESFKTLLTPGSWIQQFHSTFLGMNKTPFFEQLRNAKKLPEAPGSVMRYSSAVTLVMQFVCEAVEQKPFAVLFEERVYSKLGARFPATLLNAPDGTGLGYGFMSSIAEDFLRYGMLFTPSASKVCSEKIVTEEILKILHGSANRESYEGSQEQKYNSQWFGEVPISQGMQFDSVFADGGMFKHGNNGQGLYVDPQRDFCAINFGCGDNTSYVDYGPGFMRAAAKLLAGK